MRQRRIRSGRRLRVRTRSRLGLCRRSAKRFDETDELPALWLGKFRPHRHSLSNDAIRQDPENRSRFSNLNFWSPQTGCFLAAFGIVTVTFRAMLLEEN